MLPDLFHYPYGFFSTFPHGTFHYRYKEIFLSRCSLLKHRLDETSWGPHWEVLPDPKFIYSELSFIITYSIFLRHILRYLNSMAFLSTFSGMESYWWTR